MHCLECTDSGTYIVVGLFRAGYVSVFTVFCFIAGFVCSLLHPVLVFALFHATSVKLSSHNATLKCSSTLKDAFMKANMNPPNLFEHYFNF